MPSKKKREKEQAGEEKQTTAAEPEVQEETCAETDGRQEEACAEEAPQVGEDVETLRQEHEKVKENLLRTLAEYDNFRKRSARERETLFSDGKAFAVEKLLSVMDNFDRALDAPCSDGEFKKGMDLILKQMEEAFSAIGVSEIETSGCPFDPQIHNAVMHVDDDSLGENMVAEVFQKGYKMGDKVIRHAMVKVAN